MCVMCTIIQDSSRRLHTDRGYTTPTPSIWHVSCVQSSRTVVDGYILTEVTLHLPSQWHVSCVQSSSTSAEGYIVAEVTLHLHLLSMMCVMCTIIQSLSRRLHCGRGYTTPTLTMTCVMCTIIQYISRRLHSDRGYTTPTPSLYDVCHVYNYPVHQQTVTFWQRLHYTYTLLSMMCVMCTIIKSLNRQ
jgi:hypothetical protein